MTTHIPSPLPPTTILSTRSISQAAAHDFLAAYLARAATDPALQPNATVSEHGPVSHTTAAAPNLILHNLKRVQAGLAGEVLGRDLTFAKISTEEENGQQQQSGEGWQDCEKWEQGDDVPAEDGDRDGDDYDTRKNKAGGDEEDMEVDEAAGVPASSSAGKIDKEERKRRKKERRLAEKRAKAKAAEAKE